MDTNEYRKRIHDPNGYLDEQLQEAYAASEPGDYQLPNLMRSQPDDLVPLIPDNSASQDASPIAAQQDRTIEDVAGFLGTMPFGGATRATGATGEMPISVGMGAPTPAPYQREAIPFPTSPPTIAQSAAPDFSDERRNQLVGEANSGRLLSGIGQALSGFLAPVTGRSQDSVTNQFEGYRKQKYNNTVGSFDRLKQLYLQQQKQAQEDAMKAQLTTSQLNENDAQTQKIKAEMAAENEKLTRQKAIEAEENNPDSEVTKQARAVASVMLRGANSDVINSMTAAQLNKAMPNLRAIMSDETSRWNAIHRPPQQIMMVKDPETGQMKTPDQIKQETTAIDNLAKVNVTGFRVKDPKKVMPSIEEAKKFREAVPKVAELEKHVNEARAIVRKYGTNPAAMPADIRNRLKQRLQNISDTIRIANGLGVPSGKDMEMLSNAIGVDAEVTFANVLGSVFKTAATADQLLANVATDAKTKLYGNMDAAGYAPDVVVVKTKDGRTGKIPASSLQDFLAKNPGAVEVKQ